MKTDWLRSPTKCAYCHGPGHALAECPACGDGAEKEHSIQRLYDIIRRASVRYFEDGSTDGETAADMLKILDEASEIKNASS